MVKWCAYEVPIYCERARKREKNYILVLSCFYSLTRCLSLSDGANIWLMWDALALGSGPGNENNQTKE